MPAADKTTPTSAHELSPRKPSIAEMSELGAFSKVSPVELVRECLERIETLNPKLNAFITVTGDQALEQAHEAEVDIKNGKRKGPLHGIPVGVKDFFDTAGVKTIARRVGESR